MTDRTPLEPVPGLARSSKIVAPPPRPRSDQPVPANDLPTEPKAPTQVPHKAAVASSTVTTYKRVTLSLPLAVVDALRSRAAQDQVPQADVLMDALESTNSRLTQLLDEDAAAQPGGLFVRTSPRPSEPMTTLSLRLLADNLEVIDSLVRTVEAPSRSRLCDVALKAYLALT